MKLLRAPQITDLTVPCSGSSGGPGLPYGVFLKLTPFDVRSSLLTSLCPGDCSRIGQKRPLASHAQEEESL